MLQYEFDWSFIARPQFLSLIVDGTLCTLALAVLSGLLSFVLGAFLAVARCWPSALIRTPANAVVEIVRNVPALFWILFFYFVLPELLPISIGRMLHEWESYSFAAGVMGLVVDNGTYLSDILHNGMVKISKGQRDAASSCGMSVWQECLWVLCPQSLRTMMPAIANRMVHNFKNTSLCVAIALPELTWAIQQIESLTFKGLEVTLVATMVYAVVSLTLAFALSRCFRSKALAHARVDEEGQGDVLR